MMTLGRGSLNALALMGTILSSILSDIDSPLSRFISGFLTTRNIRENKDLPLLLIDVMHE